MRESGVNLNRKNRYDRKKVKAQNELEKGEARLYYTVWMSLFSTLSIVAKIHYIYKLFSE